MLEKWKTVMSFSFTHEAHMVKGYLESAGIETELRDEMAAHLQELAVAVGGVKVLVKESDYEKSIKLLKEGGFLKGAKPEEDVRIETVIMADGLDKKICPFCHSDNISAQKRPNLLAVILSAILGLLYTAAVFPSYKSTYKCFDCEKEWKYKKQQ